MEGISNPFLLQYLQYVDNTESPRIFHIWSALSGVAACLGRRVYLPFLDDNVFPNMFVLLVGPPAVKKSTAIKFVRKLLQENTSVRFAPDDTAGQRQGLISAMNADEELMSEEDFGEILDSLNTADSLSIDALELNGKRAQFVESMIDLRDRHHMYISASEFNTFIGHNSFDMLTFLLKMWDGEDYKYKLKRQEMQLKDPLLNLIAGSTPTSIAEAMPAAAMGQGFMSRMILVYAAQKYKRIFNPSLNDELKRRLGETYGILFKSFEGPVVLSQDAYKRLESLYEAPVEIQDSRFNHYVDRRDIHLKKLCIVLACAKLKKVIEEEDVVEANYILKMTETTMPDALGEYGMAPMAAAKQRLVEIIRHSEDPIPQNVLWGMMHRDMNRPNFIAALADLQNVGKIVLVDTNVGPAWVKKFKKRKDSTDDLIDIMEKQGEEE